MKNILALAAAGFMTAGLLSATPAAAASPAAPHIQSGAVGTIQLSARHYRGHYRYGFRGGYRHYGYRYGYGYRPYYAYAPYYGPRYYYRPYRYGFFPFY